MRAARRSNLLHLLLAAALLAGIACQDREKGTETGAAPQASAGERPGRAHAGRGGEGRNGQKGGQGIAKRCAEVREHLASYREVKRDLEGLSAEGGQLQAWFDGDRLAYLTATAYGETGKAEHEICYGADGGMRLLTTRESRYDKPFGKVTGVREDRLSFRGGKLFRWTVDGGQPLPRQSPEAAAKEKEALALEKSLADAARSVAR